MTWPTQLTWAFLLLVHTECEEKIMYRQNILSWFCWSCGHHATLGILYTHQVPSSTHESNIRRYYLKHFMFEAFLFILVKQRFTGSVCCAFMASKVIWSWHCLLQTKSNNFLLFWTTHTSSMSALSFGILNSKIISLSKKYSCMSAIIKAPVATQLEI
jgi:hypothetical protein